MERILSRIFQKVSLLLLAPWCNTSIFMHDVKKYQINIITWHWHFSFILTRCIDNFLDICQPMMAMLTSEITFLNSQSFSVIKNFFWRFVHFQQTFKNMVPYNTQLSSKPKIALLLSQWKMYFLHIYHSLCDQRHTVVNHNQLYNSTLLVFLILFLCLK